MRPDEIHQSETNHLDAIRLSIKVGGERNTDVGVFVRDLATLYTDHRSPRRRPTISIAGRSPFCGSGLGESSHQLSKTYRAYSAMLSVAGRSREAAEYRGRADASGF